MPASRKPPLDPRLLALARDLRRNLTDAEAFLWRLLRRGQLAGLKFRRQHAADPYVLDFYCHAARLGVELDGGQHNEDEPRSRDARRTAALEAQGIRVLRFWNHEVLQDTETVLQVILDTALARVGGSHARDG